MPVVFIHGVDTREGPSYQAGKFAKKAFIQHHLTGATIDGKSLAEIPQVWFPYWGDLATTFAWDMASLPNSGREALGEVLSGDTGLSDALAHLVEALPEGEGNEPLASLAKRDFASAVDVVVTLALESATAGEEQAYAEFAVRASEYAAAYQERNPDDPVPEWVDDMRTDSEFVNELVEHTTLEEGGEVLGVGKDILDAIKRTAMKLKMAARKVIVTAGDRAGDFASTRLLSKWRRPLNAKLGRFFGDIFIYMDGRGDVGSPGQIPKLVMSEIEEAVRARPEHEPLVIIGHSLGGVIGMDLLRHFMPDIEVDLFVSVGSQVAHFEEIKLYKQSNTEIGYPDHAQTPPNIKRWINIYDEVDVFAYAASGVFDRVDVDTSYDTKTYVVKAHGAYFDQARFYRRLRERIDQLQ